MTASSARGLRHRQPWPISGLLACVASASLLGPTAAQPPAEPRSADPSDVPQAAADTAANAADVATIEPGALSEPTFPEPPLTVADPATPAANEALVRTTEQQYGRNSLPSAEAYIDLAEAQRRAGEHALAAESFVTAIDIYRRVDGPFTPLVIAPLTNLGDSYREAGEHLNAVSSYGEARTVSRRAYGLLNEDQIVLIDRLSDTLLDLNRVSEAEQQQLEAMRIMSRNYEPGSPEALDAIYKYASWLGERGQYQLEREQYQRAIRIIRQRYGKNDLRLVQPLLGYGNSFRNQRLPEGQGIGALRDAEGLLLEQPEQDPLAIATVLRDMGDWDVAFNRVEYDGEDYRRAWELLGRVPNGDALRNEWFKHAIYVLYEPLSPRDVSNEPDAPRGQITIAFDVDRTGAASNLSVVDSDPPGLNDEAFLRHVRRSRFRPQMENGEIVSGRVARQFSFRYRPNAVVATTTESATSSN